MTIELHPHDALTGESVEWQSRQTDIFGQLADIAEDGDPDGCSPYGCRSGVVA